MPTQFSLLGTGEIPVTGKVGSGDDSGGGAGGGAGNGFLSVRSFGNLEIPAGGLFTFTLPRDTFKHADPKASVTLEARQADGRPLPTWLTFEPGTGKFTGRPPKNAAQLRVLVIARDNTGNEVRTQIVLNFKQQNAS